VRHVMRYPTRYYNYNRLLSTITAESLDGDVVAEGEMNAYDLDEYPIVLKRDPEGKQTIILTPTNFDPLLGAVSYVKQTGEAVASSFGWIPTNTQKQRAHARAKLGKDRPMWFQAATKTVGDTYFGPLLEAATGIDTFTGRAATEKPYEENTYLGVKMPVHVSALLSLVPPVDAFDRWNPNGMLGYKEVKDGRGNVVRPESLSIFGQARSRSDTQVGDAASQDWKFSALRNLGMRVRTIDGLKNMGYNYEDTKKLTMDLKSSIRQAQIDAAPLTGKAREERVKRIDSMIDTWLQMEWDLGRLEYWGMQNKIPTREILEQAKRQSIVTNELPIPGADTIQEKLKEAQNMRRLK